jgi:hypothetical protein
MVAKAAAESVKSGFWVGRCVGKVGHKWGNWGLSRRGWQTVGSAPEENLFTVCEQARRKYYGALFKAKMEILAE